MCTVMSTQISFHVIKSCFCLILLWPQSTMNVLFRHWFVLHRFIRILGITAVSNFCTRKLEHNEERYLCFYESVVEIHCHQKIQHLWNGQRFSCKIPVPLNKIISTWNSARHKNTNRNYLMAWKVSKLPCRLHST